MRAKTKGKHEMGKRFAVVIGVAALGVMALGAQTAIAKNVIERPNGNKVPYRAMGEVGSSVSLGVFAVPFDPQGVVTYAFDGETGPQAEIRRVRFVQKGPSGGGPSGAACSEYRTVTLFRVEPNGTSTRVASVQTGQGTGGFALERPLGEITGYYYAEVAPATTRKLGRHELYKVGGDPNQPINPKRSRGAYYRALSCLPARSPTIFAEVPAATPPSHAPPTCDGKPATIVGTEGPDGVQPDSPPQLIGTPGPDVIVALGGDDIGVYGGAGNDVICGGPGKDLLEGGAGKDTLLGQAGSDLLNGDGGSRADEPGKDRCEGGKGHDFTVPWQTFPKGPSQTLRVVSKSRTTCEVEKSIEKSGFRGWWGGSLVG